MSEVKCKFTEAVRIGHSAGLRSNQNSYILGLGVDYENGADGTTKNLAREFPERLYDVPVSEAAFTGMAVGMATSGLNPIVHHGRVEFALLAMDQILTQAAKWNYMFGGDYPCHFAARLNIGRQWGNGPQHTSSYNSLFLNTPGLDIFWPSRPSEAAIYTKRLHHVTTPTVSMEHRYIFNTTDTISDDSNLDRPLPVASIYGEGSGVAILTYGDGLAEALRVKEAAKDCEVQVICLTAFVGDRKLDKAIISAISLADKLICIDTSNYQYGLIQSTVGALCAEVDLSGKLSVFSPPFTPCATAPSLAKDYYPRSYKIMEYLKLAGLTELSIVEYNFDEHHLPLEYDFSPHHPTKVVTI